VERRGLGLERRRGEEEDAGDYAALVAILEKAEGDAITRNLAIINKAAHDGTWQAAAWWLERRYPQEYGRMVKSIELTGKDGGPVQAVSASVDIAALVSDDDGRELLARLADKLFLESGDAADPGEGAD